MDTLTIDIKARLPASIAFCFFISSLIACFSTLAVSSSWGSEIMPPVRIKITAVRHTILSSPMSGIITELAVRDGESFDKGQTLVQFDCAIPNAQFKRAQAEAQKKNALLTTTKRLQALNSRSNLDVAVAQAEASQAAAELDIARTLQNRCMVLAPFSGIVAERAVQAHQFINEGQPLFEIVDPTELELEFIVPSNWIPWFTAGYAFTVRVEETQTSHAVKVSRLSGSVDAVSQSIKVYAHFMEPTPQLLPGMSGEALIPAPAQRVQPIQ